jgi:curved DNA-binding protein CbpA
MRVINISEVLEVSHDAPIDEIKRSYRRLARQYHPDVNPDPDAVERFKDITLAYDMVCNPANYHWVDFNQAPESEFEAAEEPFASPHQSPASSSAADELTSRKFPWGKLFKVIGIILLVLVGIALIVFVVAIYLFISTMSDESKPRKKPGFW